MNTSPSDRPGDSGSGDQGREPPLRQKTNVSRKMWVLATLVLLILPLGSCVWFIWWYPGWLDSSSCIARGFATEPPARHSDALGDLRASDPQFIPQWAPDGSSIAFTTGRRAPSDDPYTPDSYWDSPPPPSGQIFVSASDGSSLQLAADGTSDAYFRIAHSPSFSPDGSQIAYSTLYDSDYEESDYGAGRYAIEVSSLDGSKRRRLTAGKQIDFSPAWAPDGSRIAFVRLYDRDACDEFRKVEIRTTTDDGKDNRRIVDLTTLKSSPGTVWREAWYDGVPVWSPNGQSLAFAVHGTERIADDGEPEQPDRVPVGDHTALYTVGPDGSDLTRLIAFSKSGFAVTSDQELMTMELDSEGAGTSIVSAPTWSPDGQRIAFMGISGGEPILYTINRDGSNLLELVRLDAADVGGAGPGVVSHHVFWTRDDWTILFNRGRTLYSVNADGSDLRSVEGGDFLSPSPDGTRIAHFIDDHSNVVLYTTSPDGWEVSALARRGEDQLLEAVGPELRPSADIASCSGGVVVPEPAKNPGLVGDCQALLKATGKLTITEVNWTANTPITDWQAVIVGVHSSWLGNNKQAEPSSQPRLLGLTISGRGLRGRISSEFGQLAELRTLSITESDLYGSIPRELTQLSKLQRLHLGGSGLHGPIPPELGGLEDLQELQLTFSDSSSVSRVNIPPELGELSSLRVLALSGRSVSGPIPPEFGKLTALRVLDLTDSNIGGEIPPELEDLPSLIEVKLDGVYGLSGCLPYRWKSKVNWTPPGMKYCY